MTLFNIVLTVIAASVFAEFAGYFIHKLLHSNKVEFLSRAHMIHHMKVYGPKMHMRPSTQYIGSTQNRVSLMNIGLEWLLPTAFISVVIMIGLWLLQIPLAYRFLFLGVASAWGLFMFSYVHDSLHIKNFWMERHWLFKNRFLKARRLHDLHHMDLADDGRMTKNYGICFFFFDWVFGSFCTVKKPFNKTGFEAAQERYSYIYDETGKVL